MINAVCALSGMQPQSNQTASQPSDSEPQKRDWFKLSRIFFISCHVLAIGFMFALVALFWRSVYNYDWIEPNEKHYINSNALTKDYLKFAKNYGYKEYGLFGDLKISMYQYAKNYEEIVTEHGQFDQDLYPSWFNDKRLGLVWFNLADNQDSDTKTLDYSLVKDSDWSDFFALDTEGQNKENIKKKAKGGKIGLYRHVALDKEYDDLMQELQKSTRTGFVFTRTDGVDASPSISDDYKAKMVTFLNKNDAASVFRRTDIAKTREDGTSSFIDNLDNYYDGKLFDDGNTKPLIFYPELVNVADKLDTKQLNDYGYSRWGGDQVVISYSDIYFSTDNNVDMLQVVGDGNDHCFNDNDDNKWCTNENNTKIYKSELSPDFSKKHNKCGNSEACFFNYKMAFDYSPPLDYYSCTSRTEKKVDSTKDEILGLSLLNLFKIKKMNDWVQTQDKNDDWKKIFNNFNFKVDKETKPEDFDKKYPKENKDTEIKNRIIKGKDLAKIYDDNILKNITLDISMFKHFRKGDDLYKVVCLDSVNVGYEKDNNHEKWRQVQNFFIPDGPAGQRIFMYPIESVLFVVIVFVFTAVRFGAEMMPVNKGSESFGPLQSNLGPKLWAVLELLIFIALGTTAISAWIVVGGLHRENTKNEWAVTDATASKLDMLFWFCLVIALSVTIILLLTFVELIAKPFFQWRKSQTSAGGAMITYASLPAAV